MALGTITRPSPNPDFTVGNRRWRTRDVQITSGANYTTGGETITAASVGLRRIEAVFNYGSAKTSNGATSRALAIDYSVSPNVKIQAYNGDAGVLGPQTEVPGNTDCSTLTARLTFLGQ